MEIEECFNLSYKITTLEDITWQDKETKLGQLEKLDE